MSDPIARAKSSIRDVAEWVDAILKERPDAEAANFVRQSVARMRAAGDALPAIRADDCDPELAIGDFVLSPVPGMPFRATAVVTGITGTRESPRHQVTFEGLEAPGPSYGRGEIEVLQRGPNWPPRVRIGDVGTIGKPSGPVRIEVLALSAGTDPRRRPLATFKSLPGEPAWSGGAWADEIDLGEGRKDVEVETPPPAVIPASLALHGRDPSADPASRPIGKITEAASILRESGHTDLAVALERIAEEGLDEDPHHAGTTALRPEWAVTLGQAAYMLRDYRTRGGAPGRMPQILNMIGDAARANGDPS